MFSDENQKATMLYPCFKNYICQSQKTEDPGVDKQHLIADLAAEMGSNTPSENQSSNIHHVYWVIQQ